MVTYEEFRTPFGVVKSSLKGQGHHSRIRSYDDLGRIYSIRKRQKRNIAIDVERYSQEIPEIFDHFRTEDEDPIHFFTKWTISEGISKLNNEPILIRLKKRDLHMFPHGKKFRFWEEGNEYSGITCLFKKEKILISIIEKICPPNQKISDPKDANASPRLS